MMFRNPKSEYRNSKQYLNPKSETQNGSRLGFQLFGFVSDFGFRASDLRTAVYRLALIGSGAISWGMPMVMHGFTATDLLNNISTYVINPIIYILFTAAFAVFIWGLTQLAANLNNEEARATGVKHIIWGIIGMVLMAGVTGILNIINNTIQSLGGGS